MGFFEYLQEEERIPPMYSTFHIGGVCLANIIAVYKRQEMEPPKELVDFLEKTYPTLLKDQEGFIMEQYLQLNTEGSS